MCLALNENKLKQIWHRIHTKGTRDWAQLLKLVYIRITRLYAAL